MLHFLIFPAHAVGDLLVLWPVNQLMSFRKEGGGTMNLASEKVCKKKERVCGMRGAVKKERKACFSRRIFIRVGCSLDLR